MIREIAGRKPLLSSIVALIYELMTKGPLFVYFLLSTIDPDFQVAAIKGVLGDF